MNIKIVCKKCKREAIVKPNESGMVNFRSGLKKLVRLECPYCHRAEWKKEESLRVTGRMVT